VAEVVVAVVVVSEELVVEELGDIKVLIQKDQEDLVHQLQHN
tara:strand:+ start:942 stop:1067 length:126 start_codon:yes stop_codon:yes gene_type:complete